MCECASDGITLQFLLETLIIPAVMGSIAFILVRKIDDLAKRKTECILGIVIIKYLMEEISNFIEILRDSTVNRGATGRTIRGTVWEGKDTIPDAVMVRLFLYDYSDLGDAFDPRDIRSHCKNLFVNIVKSYDNICARLPKRLIPGSDGYDTELRSFMASMNYYAWSTTQVYATLTICLKILERERKWFFPRSRKPFNSNGIMQSVSENLRVGATLEDTMRMDENYRREKYGDGTNGF